MANWQLEQTVDLARGVQAPQVWPEALLVTGDDQAHTWRVTVLDGGKPAQIAGTVTGYFIRSDDYMVPVEGSLDGHIASVTLNASCYAVEGDMDAVMQIESNGLTLTLAAIILPVRRLLSDSIVDNEHKIPSIAELLAQVEALKQATADAKAAAESAEAQAAAAQSAAVAANASAGTADDAAADAILAAGDAATAADEANAAAGRTEAAITASEQAAQSADASAAAAMQAAQGADASAAAAAQAAQAAMEKAVLADEAAQGAETSAEQADAAASRANAAAASIEGLTVSETVVEYGAGVEAVVSRDPESGALHLDIQTERGPQGPGYTIKGPAYATVEALEAAVTAPAVGDQYNVGAAAPYAVFRWTGTGWENQGTLQGPPGQDGLDAPQIDDTQASADHPWSGQKVQQELDALTAEDVGARPDTWMPDGLIYETTAQALEAMSQEQQAELYAQGYRAIVATYNETTTMHALAADGSLAWVGCNQDTTNLLDNPDFAIAQAGYNAYHGASKYFADRWTTGNANVNLNGKTLTYSAGISEGVPINVILLVQKIGDSKRLQGKNVTLAIKASGISVSSGAQFYMADSLFSAAGTGKNVALQDGVNVYNFTAAESLTTDAAVIVWLPVNTTDQITASITIDEIALYEGEYTADTLPPWENPDPSVELLKCMTYYQTIRSFYLSSTNTSIRVSPPMRLTPTVTGVAQEYVSGSGWEETENVTFSASNNENIRLYAYDAKSKTYAVSLSLVADL